MIHSSAPLDLSFQFLACLINGLVCLLPTSSAHHLNPRDHGGGQDRITQRQTGYFQIKAQTQSSFCQLSSRVPPRAEATTPNTTSWVTGRTCNPNFERNDPELLLPDLATVEKRPEIFDHASNITIQRHRDWYGPDPIL